MYIYVCVSVHLVFVSIYHSFITYFNRGPERKSLDHFPDVHNILKM